MTFLPDLGPDAYIASGPALRAIGWLESGHPHVVGHTSTEFRDALRSHLARPFGIWDFAGLHTCSLCDAGSAAHGAGELFVPVSGACFVAPTMVLHYVETHGYRPPDEFIAAVIECPPQSSPAYMVLMEPFLAVLRGSP